LIEKNTLISVSTFRSRLKIKFIEPIDPPAEPDNYTGTTLHRSTAINNPHPLGRKYDGTGVNVMLQDDGIIGPHIDYEGRIGAQYITWNNGDHGDHIAGTIMGTGNRDPRAKGMAPGSTLYVYGVSWSGYQGFNLISSHYFDPGIRITSTSYSNGCNAGYNSLARTMDQQSRMYPSLIHVFSAGNAGGDNCGYGAGSGWGNITGGHKSGKNVIAVGNVNLIDGLSGSSSRGPAFDGRIKPEVVAKGSSVYSTTNPHNYTTKSGTSMACPGVSGTLAQLYQAYHIFNDDADPQGGLMKAIIMNSADDLGNPGPDFRFGFGRINALRAAETIEQARYLSGSIEQGGTATHFLDVPENLHEVRIMLYWTDFEATVGTSKALVNDLDLVVNDPGNDSYLPWVLSHFPHPDSLNAPATRKVDNTNNVEQVTFTQPANGSWQIQVNAPLVPQGPQTYFITWEFITSDIQITHPAGGESFVPGSTELIRWDSPHSDAHFSLEFSADDGNTWSLISENIPGNRRYHEWTPPGVVTGQGMLRVTQNEQSSTNEFPFSIIGVPQNIQVDWVCEDFFRISWDEVFGADAYLVRKLGEMYMDSIGVTANNSFIIEDPSTSVSWVTVQAVSDDGAKGQRAIAIRKDAGIFNCEGVDLAMEEIKSAIWMVYNLSCYDQEDFPVEVKIRNSGSEPISSLQTGYSLNDSVIVTKTLDVQLIPDEPLVYLFPETIEINETGYYTLKAWVNHGDDSNPTNDTIVRVISVIDEEMIVPFPEYHQSFDDFTRCVTWPTCEQVICDLEEGWINLINLTQDEIDWRPWGGPTPTNLTGPPHDNTTGDETGNYLFLRASVTCFDKEAIMVSPCFDLTSAESATFSFYYHMYGIHSGRIHVDAFMNNTVYYDIMTPLIGEQGDEWLQAVIPLDDFVGNIVSFRFRGITGPGQLSDIAIDDVSIVVEGISVLPGDANCDGNVDVMDVITTLNYVLELNPQPFCFENADINGDGTIDVIDVLGIVNLVLADAKSTAAVSSAPANIYLNRNNITLYSDGTLAGLQFEITGMEKNQLNFLLPGLAFAHNVSGNKLIGVVYSLDNTPIPAGDVTLFNFEPVPGLKWGRVTAGNLNAERVKVNSFVDDGFQLSIFPNPAKDQVNVQANRVVDFVRISNQLGQVVEEKPVQTMSAVINTSHLSKGIYILEVHTREDVSVHKIVIE
jgi:hypothetical protein